MGVLLLKMQGCVSNTLKYLLFAFNFLVFLTGCVTLGFSIYALIDGKTVSHLVEEGASEMGESISVDIYKTSAIVLVSASSIVILISFLGCCGALKENRFLLFCYFVTLLILFMAVTIGATIAAFQSVDVIKEPLLKSMDDYDPNSQIAEKLDITRAWDDVQREFSCCGVNNFTDWVTVNGTIFPLESQELVPASCCNNINNITDCRKNPSAKNYTDLMNGCFTVFKDSLEDSKSTIGIVTGTIISVMFVTLILLFGFGLCLIPPGSYEQV